jgi:hypothetical protein
MRERRRPRPSLVGLRLCRQAAARSVLVVLALAVLFAVVGAGRRSFYCPMTQRVLDAPRCGAPRADAEAEHEQPSVDVADCCVERWRAAPPVAGLPGAHRADVDGAREAATPASVTSAALAVGEPAPPAWRVRAGPPPLGGRERRARSMVLLL